LSDEFPWRAHSDKDSGNVSCDALEVTEVALNDADRKAHGGADGEGEAAEWAGEFRVFGI
jgi:hypothetical protein